MVIAIFHAFRGFPETTPNSGGDEEPSLLVPGLGPISLDVDRSRLPWIALYLDSQIDKLHGDSCRLLEPHANITLKLAEITGGNPS
ncbi:MAG: hypothetical protein GY811_29065 [Myxococcales bacterium]|nr:hypothetical protein [Myxococcales bacterium]